MNAARSSITQMIVASARILSQRHFDVVRLNGCAGLDADKS